MSATVASSYLLPSLTPQTVAVCKSTSSSPSLILFSSSSFKPHSKPPLLSFTRVSVLGASLPRFVPQVAVSSDFEQDQNEEAVVGGAADEGQQSFSLDLKLFVGNLPFSVDSSSLAELFQEAGEVQMVEVIYDKVTQRSRGFGFVTMSSMDEVKAAAEKFNGYELEGRPLRVNYGPPPPRSENQYSGGSSFDDSNRLYVGNLSWGVDDLALQTLFSEQGKVMEARVVYDRESGRSRGFGFVTLSSPEEVSNAIESLDGFDLSGRQIRVSVAEARPPRRQF